jgi:hypothetical protein
MKESGMALKGNRKSQGIDLQKQHFIHVRFIQRNPINCDPREKPPFCPVMRVQCGVLVLKLTTPFSLYLMKYKWQV